jgi:hypothetical protein
MATHTLAALALLSLIRVVHSDLVIGSTICKDLHEVQLQDPESCKKYLVCCAGDAIAFKCRVPSSAVPYYDYSDANDNSIYDPVSGLCKR